MQQRSLRSWTFENEASFVHAIHKQCLCGCGTDRAPVDDDRGRFLLVPQKLGSGAARASSVQTVFVSCARESVLSESKNRAGAGRNAPDAAERHPWFDFCLDGEYSLAKSPVSAAAVRQQGHRHRGLRIRSCSVYGSAMCRLVGQWVCSHMDRRLLRASCHATFLDLPQY